MNAPRDYRGSAQSVSKLWRLIPPILYSCMSHSVCLQCTKAEVSNSHRDCHKLHKNEHSVGLLQPELKTDLYKYVYHITKQELYFVRNEKKKVT